jgi:hypothetical protein
MLLLTIDKSIEKLPHEAKKELLDFAEFLKQKYLKGNSHKTLKLDWAGKLAKYKDKLDDPVVLQHEVSNLWSRVHVSR